MTTSVMTVGGVGISINRLSFWATYQCAIVVLCRLANHWAIATWNSSNQQTLEIACIWARRLFVSCSLWVWS